MLIVALSALIEAALTPPVILALAAVKSQVISTAAPNVEFQVTPKVPPTVASFVIVTPSRLAFSAVNEVVVTSEADTFVIVPFVAVTFVETTSSAAIAVQVNVPSVVRFPVNVTSPFTVCRVTLDKSNPS